MTRASIHLDRSACAWRITRFVDNGAEFVFVDDPDEIVVFDGLYEHRRRALLLGRDTT